MPNRSSPRITGSTAMSRSLARSQAMTRGSGAGLAGSLKMFASTRYVTRAVPYSVSVDLESMATKKSLCGQENSQSTAP